MIWNNPKGMCRSSSKRNNSVLLFFVSADKRKQSLLSKPGRVNYLGTSQEQSGIRSLTPPPQILFPGAVSKLGDQISWIISCPTKLPFHWGIGGVVFERTWKCLWEKDIWPCCNKAENSSFAALSARKWEASVRLVEYWNAHLNEHLNAYRSIHLTVVDGMHA